MSRRTDIPPHDAGGDREGGARGLRWLAMGGLLAALVWKRRKRRAASHEGDDPGAGPPSSHEPPNDVDDRQVAGIGLLILLMLVVVLLAMGGLMRLLERRQERAAPGDEAARLPPAPRLQVDPSLELQAVRRREEALLTGYGWLDPAHGIVHIPIERAMELIAGRGLPFDTTAVDSLRVPTESGWSIVATGPSPPSSPAYDVTPPQSDPSGTAPPAPDTTATTMDSHQ